jgi:hypothetical protein
MQNDRRVRAAFVTQSGEIVDCGFEAAPRIVICEISAAEARQVTVLQFAKSALEKPAHVPGSGCGGGKHAGEGGKKSGGCGGGKKKEEVLNEQEADARVAALEGVSVLLTAKTLHAHSVLALNHAKVFSIKLDEPHSIAGLCARLQEMLLADTPPWLRKALNANEFEESETLPVA